MCNGYVFSPVVTRHISIPCVYPAVLNIDSALPCVHSESCAHITTSHVFIGVKLSTKFIVFHYCYICIFPYTTTVQLYLALLQYCTQ